MQIHAAIDFKGSLSNVVDQSEAFSKMGNDVLRGDGCVARIIGPQQGIIIIELDAL